MINHCPGDIFATDKMTSAADFLAKVNGWFADMDRFKLILDGDASTTVPAGGGTVPSVAKLMADIVSLVSDTNPLDSFPFQSNVAAATIPAIVMRITVSFRASGALYGGARYKRSSSAEVAGLPSGAVLTSADGAKWLLDEPEVYPEMLGDPQQASTTQAAFDFCKLRGGGVVVFRPTVAYRWDSGVTLDAGYVTLRANGAIIDNSHMTSGYALTVTSSLNLASEGLRQDAHYIEGLVLSGPGTTSSAYGIAFVGNTSSNPNTSPTGITVRSTHVRYFGRGVEWKTNAYILSWFGGGIFGCNYGLCCFSGASNVGENLNMHGTRITGCNEAVYTEVDTCYFNLICCSIDYNKRFANTQKGGITMIAPHLECAPSNLLNSDGTYQRPLVVGASQSAYLQIIGGNLHCNNGPPLGLDYILQNDALDNGSGGFDMDGTQVTFWRTSTCYFATGTGRTNIRNIKTWGGYYNTNNVFLSAKTCNLFFDGGFEQTTPVEAYIAGATDASGAQTAVTSRTNMVYAKLSTSTSYTHSGSRSLKCYHAGLGRVTNYQIAAPLKDKTGQYGIEWYMLNPDGLTGTMYVSVYWAKRQGSLPVDSGTQAVPVYSKMVLASQQQFTWSAAFTTWQRGQYGNALTYVPPWADTLVVEFATLNLTGSGYYYVDDLAATVM